MDPRALPDLSHRARSAHRVAATVTGVFCAAGLAWVFVTDILLYGVTRDRTLIARIETAKGWAFIGLACLLLYAVTFLSAARLDRVRRLTAAVVESIADGVLLLGHDRTIAYANPAAGRMLGRRRKELIGMTADDFSRAFRVSLPERRDGAARPVHLAAGVRRRRTAALQGDAPPARRRARRSITAAGVRLEVGAPAAWVVSVIHDISASEQLERMRDQFFAAAAHSLKTPAAVIKADAQLLEPAIPARYRSVAASIERQSDRIDRLVQNLIVLARARSQHARAAPERDGARAAGGAHRARADLEPPARGAHGGDRRRPRSRGTRSGWRWSYATSSTRRAACRRSIRR